MTHSRTAQPDNNKTPIDQATNNNESTCQHIQQLVEGMQNQEGMTTLLTQIR